MPDSGVPGQTSGDRPPFVCTAQAASSALSTFLSQLNQIATGVVEHCGGYRSHLDRRLRKYYTLSAKALVFGVNIVDRKRGKWYTVLHQRTLERTYRRMRV